MVFRCGIIPFPCGSYSDSPFTKMICRMVQAIILNCLGIFFKKILHQCCRIPRLISLKTRLAEIPPYQIYRGITGQQLIENIVKVILVFFMVPELPPSLFLSLIVTLRIRNA